MTFNATFYATCYTPDNYDADRRIQGLGGTMWRYTIDDIIRMIEAGWVFHTSPPLALGHKIIVATHPISRRKYLKTEADGLVPNNILSLPICR